MTWMSQWPDYREDDSMTQKVQHLAWYNRDIKCQSWYPFTLKEDLFPLHVVLLGVEQSKVYYLRKILMIMCRLTLTIFECYEKAWGKMEATWRYIHLQVKRNLKSPTYKSSNNNYSCINIQHATSIIHLIVLSHIKKVGKTGINVFMPEHKVRYLLVQSYAAALRKWYSPLNDCKARLKSFWVFHSITLVISESYPIRFHASLCLLFFFFHSDHSLIFLSFWKDVGHFIMALWWAFLYHWQENHCRNSYNLILHVYFNC